MFINKTMKKKKSSSLIIPPSVTIRPHDICEAFCLGITYYFFITSLKQFIVILIIYGLD